MAADILADRDGAREMQALLHQVSPRMLGAVIRNTIAHNKNTDESFLDEEYAVDNCAGSYIVSPVRENGDGCTTEEYGKVYELGMMYYCKNKAKWTEGLERRCRA
jgi:hypothetical protein